MERADTGVQPPHRREPLSGRLSLRCAACGAEPSAEAPYPFRCPGADDRDDRDHVLVPRGVTRHGPRAHARGRWPRARVLATDPAADHPFLRYRDRLWVPALAVARGASAAEVIDRIETLDRAIAAVEGHGLRATPAFASAPLAAALGSDPRAVWVKNETVQVAGSHKARHLFGIALALEVLEHAGLTTRAESDRRGLAIASCGNAALAAAVIARAAGRPLRVFVPVEADAGILARLHDLGAEVVTCPRAAEGPGDPCLARFRSAVRGGAIPFCCQGSENGLAIEGGKTLVWELVEALDREGATLDRLIVQVGGGALASACIQGLNDAVAVGALDRMPRVHAVQTSGGWPLARAYQRVCARVLGRAVPGTAPDLDTEVAETLHAPALVPNVRDALSYAAQHRSRFMWAGETPPTSIARGILDDETYDWWAVLAGMMESRGWPITVAEERLVAAHALAHAATGIAVDPTGTAGLAGLLELREGGGIGPGETAAVLFTGAER